MHTYIAVLEAHIDAENIDDALEKANDLADSSDEFMVLYSINKVELPPERHISVNSN